MIFFRAVSLFGAMATSSSMEIPFDGDEIIETMSVVFDSNVDLPDLGAGIDLLGILIADIEPGAGGVKATLLGLWKNIGQIRIVRAKKNVYSITVGSEKLARRLIDGSPWNVKGYCFSLRNWPLHLSIDDIEPTCSTYWIQAHGIPRDMLSVSNGRKLGALGASCVYASTSMHVNLYPPVVYYLVTQLPRRSGCSMNISRASAFDVEG